MKRTTEETPRFGPSLGRSLASKRLRLSLAGSSASTYSAVSASVHLARSTLTFVNPHDACKPFSFGPALNQTALKLGAPRKYNGTSGKSTMDLCVLKGVEWDKSNLPSGRPFAGIALQDVNEDGESALRN